MIWPPLLFLLLSVLPACKLPRSHTHLPSPWNWHRPLWFCVFSTCSSFCLGTTTFFLYPDDDYSKNLSSVLLVGIHHFYIPTAFRSYFHCGICFHWLALLLCLIRGLVCVWMNKLEQDVGENSFTVYQGRGKQAWLIMEMLELKLISSGFELW